MATPSHRATRDPEVEKIVLELDAKGNFSCKPWDFGVSKQGKKHSKMLLVWECKTHANFSVDFNKANGSPFYERHFDQDYPCSGLVRRDVPPSTVTDYQYSVTIDGKTFDPGGKVDP
jgi:hypothetical protein